MKTPQTDDLARGNHVVPTEWAEQLERERDEAREKYDDLATEHMLAVNKLAEERDEARAEISLKCQSVTIASGTISDLLKKSERLEKQIEGLNNFANERFDEIQRVRRERDEARELLASEKITRDHVIKRGIEMQKERDEAREQNAKLREIAEYFANQFFENDGDERWPSCPVTKKAQSLRDELDQLKDEMK